jgi:multiple sugar transport system permease protein
LALAIATPAAYALARFRLPGSKAIALFVLITQMIPSIVIANSLYRTYYSLHMLNTYWGLILADAALGIPFSVLLLRSFMAAVPQEVLEAAMVDGAGSFRIFIKVAVPLCRNDVVTAGVFSFLFAWSDFLFALTLTSTGAVKPITLGLYQYFGSQITDWSPIMATGVIACLPSVILLIVAQRFLACGITGGSLK